MSYTYGQLKNSRLFRKTPNFKVAITEMYPQIPYKLVEDCLGSTEPNLGATTLIQWIRVLKKLFAAQPSREIPRIFCKTGFQYCVHKGRKLDPGMSEVNPSTSFRRIHFSFRFSLHVHLADGLVLSGSPSTVFYDFAFRFSCINHLS